MVEQPDDDGDVCTAVWDPSDPDLEDLEVSVADEILHAYEVQLLKDPGIAGDSYRTGLILGVSVAMRRHPDYDFLAGLLYGDQDRAADAIKSVKLLVERGHIVATHLAVWGEKGEDARLRPHYALGLKKESLDRMQATIDKARAGGDQDKQDGNET